MDIFSQHFEEIFIASYNFKTLYFFNFKSEKEKPKSIQLIGWRCNGLNCSPKDVKVLTPSTVNVILFGNNVFADDQVRMRSVGWVLIQYNRVLSKKI